MKKFFSLVLVLVLVLSLSGCASMGRFGKSILSDFGGGLDRKVMVFAYNGELLKTYEGQIDLSNSSDTEVMFDLNGKRVIITNAIIITEEK